MSEPRPNPQPFDRNLFYDEVDAHRRLDCRRYDACLGTMIRTLAESFTCTACEVRDAVAPPAIEERALRVERDPMGPAHDMSGNLNLTKGIERCRHLWADRSSDWARRNSQRREKREKPEHDEEQEAAP